MPLVTRPKNFVQPQGPAQVNWANPVTRGMAFAATGPQWIDSVTNLEPTKYSPGNYSTNRFGRTLAPSANGKQLQWSNKHLAAMLSGANACSAMALASNTVAGWYPSATNADILRCDGTFSPFHLNNTHVLQETLWTAGGSSTEQDTTLLTNAGAREMIYVCNNGTTGNVYLASDLIPALTLKGTMGTPGALTPSTTNVCIGGNESSAEYFASGMVALGVYWNRALSQQEVSSLLVNPWQIFLPTVRRIWVALPSTAGAGANLLPFPGGFL
jgi:hypothetical protein